MAARRACEERPANHYSSVGREMNVGNVEVPLNTAVFRMGCRWTTLEGKTASDPTLHLVRRVAKHFLPFSRVEGGEVSYERSALPSMGDVALERAIACGGNTRQLYQSPTGIHIRVCSRVKQNLPPL